MVSASERRKILRPSRGPQKSRFGEQKASVFRMICCNHGLMGDFTGPFTGPLVPSAKQMFYGGHQVFQGEALSDPRIP